MKKLISMICILSLCLMTVACGGEKKPSDDLKAQDIVDAIVASQTELPEMVTTTELNVMMYYGIEMDKVEEYAGTYAGSGGESDEIIVFKLKSKNDVEAFKTALQNRVTKRANDFAGYAPLEEAKIANSVIKSDGLFVTLYIVGDVNAANKAYNEIVK